MCFQVFLHQTNCETRRICTLEPSQPQFYYDIYHPFEEPAPCEHTRSARPGQCPTHGSCCNREIRRVCDAMVSMDNFRCRGLMEMHMVRYPRSYGEEYFFNSVLEPFREDREDAMIPDAYLPMVNGAHRAYVDAGVAVFNALRVVNSQWIARDPPLGGWREDLHVNEPPVTNLDAALMEWRHHAEVSVVSATGGNTREICNMAVAPFWLYLFRVRHPDGGGGWSTSSDDSGGLPPSPSVTRERNRPRLPFQDGWSQANRLPPVNERHPLGIIGLANVGNQGNQGDQENQWDQEGQGNEEDRENDENQVNGHSVNRREPDRRIVNLLRRNYYGLNLSRQVNDRQANGRQASGRQTNGRQANGGQANGAGVNGRAVNGRRVNGSEGNGERPVDPQHQSNVELQLNEQIPVNTSPAMNDQQQQANRRTPTNGQPGATRTRRIRRFEDRPQVNGHANGNGASPPNRSRPENRTPSPRRNRRANTAGRGNATPIAFSSPSPNRRLLTGRYSASPTEGRSSLARQRPASPPRTRRSPSEALSSLPDYTDYEDQDEPQVNGHVYEDGSSPPRREPDNENQNVVNRWAGVQPPFPFLTSENMHELLNPRPTGLPAIIARVSPPDEPADRLSHHSLSASPPPPPPPVRTQRRRRYYRPPDFRPAWVRDARGRLVRQE